MRSPGFYLFFFFLLTCYQGVGQNGFFIKGIVTDSSGGKALFPVVITADSITNVIKTDKQGVFLFPLPENKSYLFHFSFEGYRSKSCRLKCCNTDTVVITMSPFIIETAEVVITTTRFSTSIKESPVLTNIISSKELSLSGSAEIATAISNTLPGFDFYNEGSGMTFGMQGIGSKYALFLIDGERMAGENHDNIDYNRLGTAAFEKIEIMKGASSALYGSNAIGGVINLITKTPVKPFEMNMYGRLSRFAETEYGSDIGFSKKHFSSFTSFSQKSTNGYDLTPATPDLYTVEPHTTCNAFQKITINVTSKLSLKLNASYYSRERFDVSEIPVHPLYRDLNGGLSVVYKTNKYFDFTASLHADRYDSYSILEKLDDQKSSIYYDEQNTGRITGKYVRNYKRYIEKQSLISSVEIFTDKMFSTRIKDSLHTLNNYSFSLLDEVMVNRHVFLSGGIRYDYYTSMQSSFSPKISILYSKGKFNYRATFGKGFRAPSIKEQYYDFDLGFIAVKGNDSLRPEHSGYASFSIEFNHKKNNVSVNAYHNRIDDMIHEVLLENTTNKYTYININEVAISGIDLLNHYFLRKNLSLNGGCSYTYAFDMIKKEELGGVCRISGIAGLEYSWGWKNNKGVISLNGKINSRRAYENYNPVTYSFFTDYYPAFSLWRATLSQHFFNNSVALNLGVTNILDYRSNTDLVNTDPGRSFFCKISFSPDKLSEHIKSKNKKQ